MLPQARLFTRVNKQYSVGMNTIRTVASLRQLLSSSRGMFRYCDTINRQLCTSRTSACAQEITKRVKSYGKLYVNLPWSVEVKPTDPHRYPNMDTIVVKISSSTSSDANLQKLLNIFATDEICRITAKDHENFNFSSDSRFLIEAPIQYDVDARVSGDSSVSVAGMVSDSISAETERGNLSGAKLQAKKIKFNSSQGGSIYLLNSLQGDIEMRTAKNGSITAEKCLGTNLEMRTEDGDVSLGSNYCERALFTTVNGNLNLNNLHMDAIVDIKEKGSLNISCLDGSLQAKLHHGDAKVHVVRLTGKSQIVSEGSIDLIVPRENNVRLNLRSNKMTIDKSLTGTHSCSGEEQVFDTPGEIPLIVKTPGNLQVTGLSWAESFQLGKFAK